MRTQPITLLLIACTGIALAGCGGENNGNPAPPSLGVQIERMGRAAINTAVVDPFNGDESLHGVRQDGYNSSEQADWGQFASVMAGNLAILDGLDRNCGNQLLAGPTAAAGRYGALAGVLADDQLYVNTNSGVCQQYLAVEANFLGISNSDCGGRTTLYDVVDASYAVLAAGALSGVDDGVPADADPASSTSDFPFLHSPT